MNYAVPLCKNICMHLKYLNPLIICINSKLNYIFSTLYLNLDYTLLQTWTGADTMTCHFCYTSLKYLEVCCLECICTWWIVKYPWTSLHG